MGLENELVSMGRTEYYQLNNVGAEIATGEGDSVFKPMTFRPRGRDWPTLVIQAGYSQSWNSLEQRAKWWFAASNHYVKIVLLAKADLSKKRITLKKWKEIALGPRPGATTTRASAVATLKPECILTINISRRPGTTNANRFNTASYSVTNGPLVLEFVDLFLRQRNQGETDIVINDPVLQQYAILFWMTVAL
jgi:hypothetical protein